MIAALDVGGGDLGQSLFGREFGGVRGAHGTSWEEWSTAASACCGRRAVGRERRALYLLTTRSG